MSTLADVASALPAARHLCIASTLTAALPSPFPSLNIVPRPAYDVSRPTCPGHTSLVPLHLTPCNDIIPRPSRLPVRPQHHPQRSAIWS
ncbi:hypothetical protein MVEN_01688900 [Mycena venus]|uniref:Uncharacterized protein n=1 Tax=Mycena venus TaxID=2733690 RepID=A0A8H6XMY1_9AGAR|nr:hypothetical protein MVEN_01688900 [Mycena venus]